ncbi:MAG: response regulator, partial [Eubacteriales bacterium]|nr:response regulator [Eubacteriales bacterium]
LIADDEYLVRLGLQTTIDWEGHGFQIVGLAADGTEAIRLFADTDPDILLTDIKMPGVDGLELIEQLKRRKPSLYVVILTHYNDFAYAQKAILLGASQYILKSELNEASLLNTLERLLNTIEEDEQPRNDCKKRLQDYFRRCILMNDSQGALPSPEDALPQKGHYMLASCRCDTSVLPEERQNMFYRSVRNMINKSWPDLLVNSTQVGHRLRVYMLLSVPEQADGEAPLQSMTRLSSNVQQYFSTVFQVGLSTAKNEKEIKQLVREAESALNQCFFSEETVSTYRPAPTAAETESALNPANLQDLVRNREWLALMEYIREVFIKLRASGDIHRVQTAYIDFLSVARQLSTRYSLLGNAFLTEKKLNYDNFSDFCHIDAVEMVITDIYRTVVDLLDGQGKCYSSVIKHCMQYMHAHYNENIALSDAAEAVNVSKCYLSLLFKQETGINFSKYLINYRMENAKRLLTTTMLKTYEVAEQVGFPNPYYFSKVFKDVTGLSCKDFKNLNR